MAKGILMEEFHVSVYAPRGLPAGVRHVSVKGGTLPITRSSARDEGRPLGIGFQGRVPNHRKLHRSSAVVVSVPAQGRPPACQMGARKTNASEPPMRCRKRSDVIETGLRPLARDKSGGHLVTALTVTGIKVA